MAAPYNSVLEMAQDNLSADSVRRLERRLADRIVISALCALRCSKDITQEQLAKKMGMSKKEIAALEDGTDHRISVPLLFKHASALGMNVAIILDTDKTDSTETVATHAINSPLKKSLRRRGRVIVAEDKTRDRRESLDSGRERNAVVRS